MEKGLGCLKSPYDSRDYQFSDLVVSVGRQTYPEEYLDSMLITSELAFDQGDTQMCCACAVAMSRYIFEYNDSGNRDLFSPAYIYGNRPESVVVDGIYTGEGMSLKDALKQLCNSGCCLYTTIPKFGNYSEMQFEYNKVKEVADKEAYPFRTSSYYAVKRDCEIKKAIMTSGCVLCGYMVTSGWYDVKKDGIIPTYGNIEGGHAVLIVGWKKINNEVYWIILNSWGPEWGDFGFGYIKSTEMMMEAYCILDNVHELQLKEEN